MTETTTEKRWGDFVLSADWSPRLRMPRLGPLSDDHADRMVDEIIRRREAGDERAAALPSHLRADDADESRQAIDQAKLDARRDADEPTTVIVAALVAAPGAPSLPLAA